jgi:hypothetical protein
MSRSLEGALLMLSSILELYTVYSCHALPTSRGGYDSCCNRRIHYLRYCFVINIQYRVYSNRDRNPAMRLEF